MFLCFCVCQYNDYVFAGSEPIIRVLILKNKNIRIRSDKSIPLNVRGEKFSSAKIKGLTIKSQNDKAILFFDRNKEKIYNFDNRKPIIIKSSDKRGIWVDNKRYSGIIEIFVLRNKILVVNKLGIEKYLSSVVGSEMPHKWPLEALKAQAIASRTYALKQNGNNIYDVDSTQMHQVYNGLESRTPKTRKAVRATRSLVLTYKNKLINALFHSSSGGMTENSEDVWKNKYSYLRTVKDFDQNSKTFKWQKSFSQQDLRLLFPKIGGINKIKINDISNTGRIKSAEIYGENGSRQISGNNLRKKMRLKSTLVRFRFLELNNQNEMGEYAEEPYLIIMGKGAGHGVGMSQWGAKYLANEGKTAENILKYFYKGVQIKPFRKSYK